MKGCASVDMFGGWRGAGWRWGGGVEMGGGVNAAILEGGGAQQGQHGVAQFLEHIGAFTGSGGGGGHQSATMEFV